MTDNQDAVTLTPRQITRAVMAGFFDEDDPGTSALVDQLVSKLDDAGVLIDPVENGVWQNVKAGHMECRYENGSLRMRMTEAGKRVVENMGRDS